MRGNLQISPLINLMVQAARRGSRALKRDFFELESFRSSEDKLKAFSQRSEQKAADSVIEVLKTYNDTFGFIVEDREFVSGIEDENEGWCYNWVVDPIDGTLNFMHGNPNFSISIALERVNEKGSEKLAGLIYAPAMETMFWAEKNKGAYILQEDEISRRISVAREKSWINSTIGINNKIISNNDIFLQIRERNAKLRMSGAVALDLAYVACGRLDMAICEISRNWDTAAGIILIKEAKGYMKEYSNDIFLFSNQFYCSNFTGRSQLTIK